MDIEPKKVYHFVAKEDMKNKISDFLNNMELDFSKGMRLILDTMMPLLDNYTIFENESSDFGYSEFGAEVDIRFYIDPNVYRKLKNAHGIMHSFSVAVMVRKMIELFFYFIEAKSFEWLTKVMSCYIKKMIRMLTKTGRLFKNRKNMVHMFGEEQMEEYIAMIFSKNYTLLGTELLKKRLDFR